MNTDVYTYFEKKFLQVPSFPGYVGLPTTLAAVIVCSGTTRAVITVTAAWEPWRIDGIPTSEPRVILVWYGKEPVWVRHATFWKKGAAPQITLNNPVAR